MDIASLILGLIFGFMIGFLIMKLLSFKQHKNIRKEAVKWSRNAITWEIYEKILPALPNFPYAPKDMVFIGKWCDYIVFDWLSEWNLSEIIFLELKSGKARLNANEKAIKNIISQKKVRYSEVRIGSTKNDK